MSALIEIEDLRTRIPLRSGTVHAVDGLSFEGGEPGLAPERLDGLVDHFLGVRPRPHHAATTAYQERHRDHCSDNSSHGCIAFVQSSVDETARRSHRDP